LRPDDDAIDAFASLSAREIEPSSPEVERFDVASSQTTSADVIERDARAAGDREQRPAARVMQRVRGWLRRVG
jgi:hypothetical protein